jgi:hypothetical protein
MKPNKIMDDLRKGPLKKMADDDFAMLEKEVEDKGIKNLTGYGKRIIEKAQYDLANSVEKAKSVAVGDMVSWNSSGGRARGKVVRVARTGVVNVPETKFSIKAEEGDPAVLIRLYRDGDETDTLVGHKMSTLTKI